MDDRAKIKKKKIFIVDDNPIVRETLKKSINFEPDMKVGGEAGGGLAALKYVAFTNPDMVIVDLMLHDMGGVELVQSLRLYDPKLPILVLSMHDELMYAQQVLWAGAQGFVMKQRGVDEIKRAIRIVMMGKTYLSREVVSALMGANSPFQGEKESENPTISYAHKN